MSKQNLQETRADELKPGAVVRFAPGVATVANVSTEGGMAAVTYIGAQIPVLYPPDMRLQVLTRPYRLEERDANTGAVLGATQHGYDGPIETPEQAQDQFARELRMHPDRYALGSPYRLVLLGPDRTTR